LITNFFMVVCALEVQLAEKIMVQVSRNKKEEFLMSIIVLI
jgi:hypothetical protein